MNNMRKYFIMMKKQKVRIENYNVVGPQLCEGKKKYMLKISGRKCTQMLGVIISGWQNYGQLFFILFHFLNFLS